MNRVATASAPALDIGEVTIVLDKKLGWASYIGTRMQIESEGFRPPNDRWPDGFASIYWETDVNDFWLRRERPEGVKGPRRSFLDCDHWDLRVSRKNFGFTDYVILRKTEELREIVFNNSPAGKARFNRQWEQFVRAHDDRAFQQFKAGIPALVEAQAKGRRRTRKEKRSCEPQSSAS